MKTFLKLSFLAIVSGLFLTSCSKDNDDAADFDINNPIGYVMIYNKGNNTVVYEFAAGNKLNVFTTRLLDEYYYTVLDNNKIKLSFGDEYYLIEGGNVKYYVNDVQQTATIRLVKKPEVSQLAGKTFKGVYKKPDGSVLHPSFFYSFHPNANKVDAGYVVGTAVRTENYNSIGNIGSRTEHYGPQYYEMLVLHDGKLYASYTDDNGSSFAVLDPL